MTFDVETLKVTAGHKDLAAYIKRESGKAVRPEVIALVDTLRDAYRKDPTVVAERERAAVARRAERLEGLRKKAERLQREAARLGYGVNLIPNPDADEPGHVEGDRTVAMEDIVPDEESQDTEPEPAPAPRRPRRTRQQKTEEIASVTPIRPPVNPLEATPADDAPLSPDIDVIEVQDGWAQVAEDADAEGEAEDW